MDNKIEIKEFRAEDINDWQEYVASHEAATVFHRYQWSQAVERAYGHRPCHLIAWQGDKIAGLLPMFFVKSVFAGKVLVSIPYATYGGILADLAEIEQALFAAATEKAKRLDAEYLELRNLSENSLDIPEITRYDTFIKALPDEPSKVLAGLPKKARAAARNGLKNLKVETGPQLLDPIYDIYSKTMKRLGSPNYSRKLFHELAKSFGEDCVCLAVMDGDTLVSGVVSFVFRDVIVAYFSGSQSYGMRLNCNNVMYVGLMEYAVERGLKYFDFNRTRRDNSGPHSFKRHMGFTPQQLHYQISLNKADELPNMSPSNSKFAAAGKAWKKMPIWFTRPAGAVITRWIP